MMAPEPIRYPVGYHHRDQCLFACKEYLPSVKDTDKLMENIDLTEIKTLDDVKKENYKVLMKFRNGKIIENDLEEKLLDQWALLGFVRYGITNNGKATAKLSDLGYGYLKRSQWNK